MGGKKYVRARTPNLHLTKRSNTLQPDRAPLEDNSGMDENRTNSILQSIASMKAAVANNGIKNPPKRQLPIPKSSPSTTPTVPPATSTVAEPASIPAKQTPSDLNVTPGIILASSLPIPSTTDPSPHPVALPKSQLAPGNLRNASQPVRDPASSNSSALAAGVKRPRPTGRNCVLVSTRQRGNKVLEHIRHVPWEWSSDIDVDYIPGPGSLVLFLSLKYHRLHPEYILNRMAKLGRAGAGTAQPVSTRLRVLLVSVDIDNHQEALKELTKTSMRQDFTMLLAWSAEEAGKYISELKIMEAASAQAIQGHAADDYESTLQDVLSKVKGVNKNDSLSLVAQYGSLKSAILDGGRTAEAIGGWGAVKVKKFKEAVSEPFIYNKRYPERSS